MARIERATSPLPRECSTTEPHGHRHGSGHGPGACAQTAVDNGLTNTSAVLPAAPTLERETGIEPASLAWKARVLPLNYSRTEPGAQRSLLVEEAGFEPAYALAGRFTVCCL